MATLEDIPALENLIAESVRGLQSHDYSREQVEAALGTIYGTDQNMIDDGTFFVIEDASRIVACGGWCKRRTAFGSSNSPVRDDSFLDPGTDPAKIRGFFVHPQWARRGLATQILHACEAAAAQAGFRSYELYSTLTGVPLYARHGYTEVERVQLNLPNGLPYTAVRMRKPCGS